MSCSNNLKQLGLATHNHHDTYRRLPPGCANGTPPFGTVPPASPVNGYSWMVYLLPFMEQGPLFEKLPTNVASTDATVAAVAGSTALNGAPIIAGFRCPSSPLDVETAPNAPGSMISDYVAVAGVSTAYATAAVAGFTPQNEVACSGNANAATNGAMYFNSKTKMASFTDGLSNTLLISEVADFFTINNTTKSDFRPSRPYGFTMGCANNTTTPSYNTTTIGHNINLKKFAAESCTTGPCSTGGNQTPLISAHSGVVVAVLGDGSVRTLPSTTDAITLSRMAARNDGQPVTLP
jgi:hypothetical protein